MKKKIIFIFILFFSIPLEVMAMHSGSHYDLGIGVIESALTDNDSDNEFNYSGMVYSLGLNFLYKVNTNWHHYYGLNIDYIKKTNNADSSTQSEKSTQISPGIFYKIYYKNLFFSLGYNYAMAEHIGTGLRMTTLDFDIHKASLKAGYDYPITENLYIMGAYKYSYGFVTELEGSHDYVDHIVSLNLIYRFGEHKPASNDKASSPSSGKSSGPRSHGKHDDRRNKLYDFLE